MIDWHPADRPENELRREVEAGIRRIIARKLCLLHGVQAAVRLTPIEGDEWRVEIVACCADFEAEIQGVISDFFRADWELEG